MKINTEFFGPQGFWSLLMLLVATSPGLHGKTLINVDFAAGSGTGASGFCRHGQTTNDFWNFYTAMTAGWLLTLARWQT